MSEKSSLRCFIFIILAMICIAIFTGFEIYIRNNQITIPELGTDIGDLEEEFEDTEVDDNTEPGDVDDEEEDEVVPFYSNGYNCVTDALKLIDNCKGYKTTANLTAITDIMGIGSATQTAKEIMITSGNYYFKETFANCTISFGQNYYRYFYSNDGENVEYKKTSKITNGIPDWSATMEDVMTTKQEVIEKYDYLAYDAFNIRPTKQNSTLVKFDRTTNSKYYIVSFIMNVNKLPEDYINNTIKEGGLDSLTFSSVKLTFYIEKSTLYIRKVEKREEYTVKKGIETTVSAYQEIIVNSINTELYPSKPSYC